MAPPKKWDEDEDSTPPSSPPQAATIARRNKFDDEEGDSDVVENWDSAEDSEEEREKAKKVAAAKAKAEEEARRNHKTKSQRIEERRLENMRKKQEEEEETSSEEEEEVTKRERLRRTEQAADLKHAEDLLANVGLKDRAASTKAFVATDATGKAQTVDLASLPLLKPNTKDQFAQLRTTLAPILAANAMKPQYSLFLQEFVKDITRELPSEQIKKIASALTAFSNEKMREEKAVEKGGKKTKGKAKAILVASRNVVSRADTTAYDDDNLDDDDFM